MIYINQNQILGLNEYFENIETGIKNINTLNYLSKSGGIINGKLISQHEIFINSGIDISGNYFYLNLTSQSGKKIIIGDTQDQNLESGCFLKLYSISGIQNEKNIRSNLILESTSGNCNIYLGDSSKILFDSGINFYSKDDFYIKNSTGNSLYLDNSIVELNRNLSISNIYQKNIYSKIEAGENNSAIIDTFKVNNFYWKKYLLSIYTRDSVKIKNITFVMKNFGLYVYEDGTNNFPELENISLKFESDINFVYFKIQNNSNKKIIIKGICSEWTK